MLKLLFLLPVGLFCHCLLPELPEIRWFFALFVVALLCVLSSRWLTIPGILMLGFACGGIWGNWQLDHRLPAAQDKTDLTLVGKVSSLTIGNGERTLFYLDVLKIVDVEPLDGVEVEEIPELRKLRLSWYGRTNIQPGETWQLRVRLRTPRGLSNPGTFDYSGWLFAQGVSATGYVRNSDLNQRLVPDETHSILHWRHTLLNQLQKRYVDIDDIAGVMAALILGEKGLISDVRFEQLKLTGTVHLIVVSGLHIGMVCALGVFLGLGVGRLAAALGATIPAPILALPIGFAAALLYSMLAGFGLPVQRALIMSAAALIALAMRKSVAIWRVIGLALCVIAILDPMAVINSGFWLSFVAVCGLIGWFSYRPQLGRWRQLLQAQLVVFVSLAPWLIFFHGSVSLWSIPFNLIAIPWVSLVIVPCCLLGALFQFWPAFGNLFWDFAAWQIEYLLSAFAWVSDHRELWGTRPVLQLPTANEQILGVLLVISLLCLLPRGLGKVVPIGVLVAVLGLHRSDTASDLELTVLDVGQGLAVVVRERERVLIYDTGPGYLSGFNTGDAVVVPYLQSHGLVDVEQLVISHGDSDHSGGTQAVMDQRRVRVIMSGEPDRLGIADSSAVTRCAAGMRWQWDAVKFRVLWPPVDSHGIFPKQHNANNRSCVLLIEMGDVRILLPGDISARVENAVLQQLVNQGFENDGPENESLTNLEVPEITILVAPHHGSRSSSSAAFVARLRPEHVVFSAGFNHHFGHPHSAVVDRYRASGAQVWNTATSGALSFRWSFGQQMTIQESARHNQRYWH